MNPHFSLSCFSAIFSLPCFSPFFFHTTTTGTIKVGDLGLGRALSDHTPEAFSKVGTPLYMSPEALKGEGYDMKSDIWSLGCVL